jgi:hypothetical protein
MPTTTFISNLFLLNIDGKDAGFVKSVEGGGIRAEVVKELQGPQPYVKKHIGLLKYEDFGIETILPISPALSGWIAESRAMKQRKRDVSVIVHDAQLNVIQERQYSDTLITETTIPALDASSKDPGLLNFSFTPQSSRTKKGSGKLAAAPVTSRQKQWLVANFRWEIDGLDCKKVIKIDGFGVRQTVKADQAGGRVAEIELGKLDFPNLRILIAESSAQSWFDWHEDFVVKGNNSEAKERKAVWLFCRGGSQIGACPHRPIQRGHFRGSARKGGGKCGWRRAGRRGTLLRAEWRSCSRQPPNGRGI